MAKRKKRKKSTAAQVGTGISQRSRKILKSEAEKARSRLRSFSKRADSDNYFAPDSSEYTLAKLLKRIGNGESVRSVLREVRNLTADKLKLGKAKPVVSDLGYTLKPSEVRAIKSAVTEANKNISKAREKFDFAKDILPEMKNAQEVIRKAVNSDSIKFQLDLLKQYTPENLIPTAINEYGEAGTKAEVYETTKILEKENDRRKKIRETLDPQVIQGYFVSQDDYDTREINIKDIVGIQGLRSRAETWDDFAITVRANKFLYNYEKTLELVEVAMQARGFYNETIEERFAFIKETIGKLYNHEEEITFISKRMPFLDISIISPSKGESAGGSVDFDEIYNAWTYVDDLFFG